MLEKKMEVNSQTEPEQKSCRKRFRKSLSNSMNVKQSLYDESIETVDLTVSPEKNHLSSISAKLGVQVKKLKTDEIEVIPLDDQPARRSQPHRAARFTESYSSIAGVDAAMSDEEPQQNGECKEEESNSSSGSDSDCEIIPQSPPNPLPPEQQLEWENKVQALTKQLQYEDIKLLLLKKLKQSQTKKEVKKEEVNYTVPPHVKITQRPLPRAPLSNSSSSLSPSKKLLPTLKVPSQAKLQFLAEKRSTPVQDAAKSTKPAAPTSTTVVNNLVQYTENLNRANITIHPISAQAAAQRQKPPALNTIKNEVSISLVPAPTSTSEQKQQQPQHSQQQQQQPQQQQQQQPQQQQQQQQQQKTNKEKELTAQQQAAAKLLLQKEVKRTLMQIPSPKPVVERIEFMPNGNSPDFIWLLGLDIVVDYLTKKTLEKETKDPNVCSDCKMSFTESWKTVDRGSSKSGKTRAILCQTCFYDSMKKKLRAEHTAHLKSAFTKILQCEKEIEKLSRMSSASAPVSVASSALSSSSSSSTSSSLPAYRPPAGQQPFAQSVLQKPASSTPPQRTVAHQANLFQGNNLWFQQRFPKLTPQQVQAIFQNQAQNFMASGLQLAPHMMPFAPFMAQYPYQLMNKSSSSSAAADLQRQYLLDMISSRSSPSTQAHRKS